MTDISRPGCGGKSQEIVDGGTVAIQAAGQATVLHSKRPDGCVGDVVAINLVPECLAPTVAAGAETINSEKDVYGRLNQIAKDRGAGSLH